MSAGKQNHIYVYDENEHQIIVIDGETGEKVQQKDDDVTLILKYLSGNGEDKKLRKFAVWCAHQTNKDIKPIQRKLIELAEKAIQDNADPDKLEELYTETEGAAIATDTVGLRQGSEKAPAFLATRECINPNAFDGAMQAARFHRLWVEMNEQEEKNKKVLKEVKVHTSSQKVHTAMEKQVNFLLDLIGS